jgi:osmotically-inducible protein OsmY
MQECVFEGSLQRPAGRRFYHIEELPMSSKTRCIVFTTVALMPLSAFANAQAAQEPKPDNSRVNEYQNGERGMTAEQQSNKEADVNLTRKIRQALVQDKQLSTYAQNVKIITEGGQVVLKGPVKNQEEKDKVESKAGQIAGLDRVRSELEVVTR